MALLVALYYKATLPVVLYSIFSAENRQKLWIMQVGHLHGEYRFVVGVRQNLLSLQFALSLRDHRACDLWSQI